MTYVFSRIGEVYNRTKELFNLERIPCHWCAYRERPWLLLNQVMSYSSLLISLSSCKLNFPLLTRII